MSFVLVETKQICIDESGMFHYIWEIEKEHYFKGCDTVQLFPTLINLYLKQCTNADLNKLVDSQHFLRINCYEQGKNSRVSIQNLTINGLNDSRYKDLLRSCPYDMVPCEINLGPFWHYLGVNKVMCKMRNLSLGFIVPDVGYIMGFVLYGRDSYTYETEESIKEVEKSDEIFIVRKK